MSGTRRFPADGENRTVAPLTTNFDLISRLLDMSALVVLCRAAAHDETTLSSEDRLFGIRNALWMVERELDRLVGDCETS